MKTTIELLIIGDVHQSILLKLQKNLEWAFKRFNISVKIIQEAISLEKSCYNPVRRQYNASKVLYQIIHHVQDKQSFRTLGILDTDIYSGPLNFVFGIAISPKTELQGFPVVALISITRLKEKFYRRPENRAFFELRILKEAMHELGHTFSLEHCDNSCIMRFSNSLMDTDKKPPQFCDSCSKKLTIFFKSLN